MAEIDTQYNRGMAEVETQYHRGRSRGRGRGRYGGRGRGRGRGEGKGKPDGVKTITGIDGKSMEVHPSYNFSDQDWHNIPHEERNRLIQERQAYNANKRQRISEVKTEDRGSHQQQSYAGGAHIMGGRNEQEAIRHASRRGDGNA